MFCLASLNDGSLFNLALNVNIWYKLIELLRHTLTHTLKTLKLILIQDVFSVTKKSYKIPKKTHLELLFTVIQLHVQAMRSIPVPIDDICPAVTVEVCQSNPSAMLHGVLHTYR